MGNYCDWADVAGRYPKIGTVVGDNEIQTSYIAGVEAIMDAHLARQFTAPISGKPPLLTEIAIDLTYAKIMIHSDKASGKLHEAAMKLLEQITDSTILLVDSDGQAVAALGQAVWGEAEDYNHTFSMLREDDVIDPDLLDDLADARS